MGIERLSTLFGGRVLRDPSTAAALSDALGVGSVSPLVRVHAEWIAAALAKREQRREPKWTESLAVGAARLRRALRRRAGERGHYRRIDAAGEVAGKHFHPLLLK